MFGRFSKAKRETAIALMIEKINFSVQTLIYFTSKEQFNTPTAPYVDELYFLCFIHVNGAYAKWRKRRTDALEDLRIVFSAVCECAVERFKGKMPFRFEVESGDDLVRAFLKILEARVKAYDEANYNQTVNVAAELAKLRRENGCDSGELNIGDWLVARGFSQLPFEKLIAR